MSYEKVKSIKIKDGKVFMKSCSNNVYPHDYSEWECSSLTEILAEQGREALDLEILREYESGSFQSSGNGKYNRALMVLRHMPEYADFDWRVNGPEYEENQKRRKTEAFQDLLRKALKTRLPKDKYIIKKDYFGGTVYLRGSTRRSARWTREKEASKIFHWIEDALGLKVCFTNADSWQIEQI